MNKKRKVIKVTIYLIIITILSAILIIQNIGYIVITFFGVEPMTTPSSDNGCDFATHHLEYNKETGKMKCAKGVKNPNPQKYKYCDDFTRELTEESSKCIKRESIE